MRPSKVIPSLDCPKSVSSTRCLAALKWWLVSALPQPLMHAHHGAVAIRRRAPVHSVPSCHSSDLYKGTSKHSELRLPQERVKYVLFGGSEVVVCISIASTSAMHASWCCDDPPPRPRPVRPLMPLQRPSKAVILSLDCPKSVSSTRCLAALKWWLEEASPPTTGARIMMLWRSAAAPPHPHRTITPLYDSQRDLPK